MCSSSLNQKPFEFSVEEGGMFYQLRIYGRGRDSLKSIFMGKGCAKRLLFILEELIAGQSRGQFAKSFHEGDKCFILQLGSNSYGFFFVISELIHGRRKGSIGVPEGKSGSGWRGFSLHLRKAIDPESLAPKQAISGLSNRDASKSFASVVAGNRKYSGGEGDGGKNKSVLVQNSKPRDFSLKNHDTCLKYRDTCKDRLLSNRSRNNRDTCKDCIPGQRKQPEAMILSTINGIESNDVTAELTLDIFMRLERRQNGRWDIVWPEVNEKGPKERRPKGKGGLAGPRFFRRNSAKFQTHPQSPTTFMTPIIKLTQPLRHLQVLLWWVAISPRLN